MFKNFVKIENNKILPWIILILINGIIYSIIIINYSGLTADDFVVFSIIKDNPNNFISVNQSDPYFLFSRPLSYFFMFMDYHLLNLNTDVIKIIHLGFHIVFISLLYYILNILSNILKFKSNYIFNFIICLIFSFSEISLDWIMWISNKTELLMSLFYILSLFFIILYLKRENNIFLFLYILFFIFSALSKQSSVHLPILIIILAFSLKQFYDFKKIKKIIIASIIGIIFSFFIISIFYNVDLSYQDFYWKKLFSAFGNLFLVIFPYKSGNIYWLFLSYKWLAVIIFLIIIVLIFAVKKIKKSIKTVLLISFTLLISLYPRIITETESRTLSIQLLWFILILTFLVYKYVELKLFKYIILLFFLSINVLNFCDTFDFNKNIIKFRHYEAEIFLKKYQNNKNLFSVISFNNYIFPYYIYFIENSAVGKDSISISPFDYNWIPQSDFDPGDVKKSLVRCLKSKDTITMETTSDKLRFYINNLNKFYKEYKILDITYSEYRGINKIVFILPDFYTKNNYKLVYFDGLKWIDL